MNDARLPDVGDLLERMAAGLEPSLPRRPLMVGIHTGGAWLAERLHASLGLDEPLGTLDISFYRDDFTRLGIHPQVRSSHIPVDVEERHLLLVDDVLHTGRTVRAAMNELFDFGRPASITLAVLVERSGRELPIQPDVVGQHLHLDASQHVKLAGPADLRLELLETAS